MLFLLLLVFFIWIDFFMLNAVQVHGESILAESSLALFNIYVIYVKRHLSTNRFNSCFRIIGTCLYASFNLIG